MTARGDSLWHALTSSFGARLAMAVLNYGLFWELSRRLDTAALGGFSVLMNLFFMVQGLPLLGLSAPLARRAATDPAARQAELSNALAFALPVAVCIGGAIGLAGAQWYHADLHAAFWLLGAAIVPTAWVLVAETHLLGAERMSVVARVQCLESLGRAVGAVAVVEAGFGLTGIFGVFLVLRVAMALLYRLHREVPRVRLALVTGAAWLRNWREVPVFLGIALATVVVARVDVLALSQGAGLAAAGVYAAAARLYEASLMLPTIAAMVMLPALARLYVGEPAAFRTTLLKALRLSLGGGLAIALAVAALADPLVALLYKPALAEAGAVLRVLIFGAVLMTADQLLSSTMLAAQAQRDDLRTMALALVSLSLLLVLLVPAWGPLGAAWSVVGSLCLRLGWRLRWAVRHLQLAGLPAELGRIGLAASVGLAGLVGGLALGPAWALVLAWAGYAAAARAVGLIDAGVVAGLRARWLQRRLGTPS